MKLFVGIIELIARTVNVENVASLKVDKVVLWQCNLVDRQYEQKILYTTPNKSN